MHIQSSAFRPHGEIPRRFTCEGEDVSPPLSFDTGGIGAKGLALVVDDPDAPSGSFAHWVVYNLPPSTTRLAEGVTRATLPSAARLGTNGFGRVGWAGPCPRAGAHRHRYVFTLYALDVTLPDLGAPTKDELIAAMAGHVLAQAELVGSYALSERSDGANPTR